MAAQRNPSHGTINVLIGDRNGLVAVTDSRLSSGTKSVGTGQKLYKIDDNTICTIAGFYNDPGPSLHGVNPLTTSIPTFIHSYISILSSLHTPHSLAEKMEILLEGMRFPLRMITALNMSLYNPSDYKSTITLAGYEGDALKVVQATLTPSINGADQEPEVFIYPEVTLSNKILFFTAGMDDAAQDMLTLNDSEYDAGNPLFVRYFHARTLPKSDLSIQDLLDLANAVEAKTAERYPKSVGAEVQMAVLSEGKVSRYEQPHESLETVNEMKTVNLSEIDQIPSIRNLDPDHNIVVVLNSSASNETLSLDGVIMADCRLQGVHLTYHGSRFAFFGKNNVVNDTDLQVSPNVPPDDPFIGDLLKRYPQIKLRYNITTY